MISVCNNKYKIAKGPFIAIQLNSTWRRVELRRRSVYSDADETQLDVELSTRSRREQLSLSARVSIATQLNSTRRRVELHRYKRAFSC